MWLSSLLTSRYSPVRRSIQASGNRDSHRRPAHRQKDDTALLPILIPAARDVHGSARPYTHCAMMGRGWLWAIHLNCMESCRQIQDHDRCFEVSEELKMVKPGVQDRLVYCGWLSEDEFDVCCVSGPSSKGCVKTGEGEVPRVKLCARKRTFMRGERPSPPGKDEMRY
jgi:hypothetical protein